MPSKNKIKNFTSKLAHALRKAEKYKKRSDRLKRKMELIESPKRRTKKQINQSTTQLKRTLLFHNTIISEIRKKVENRKTRQIISKIVAGRILKKYGLVDDNSRATTGKKETITKNMKKMQKQFLTETMKQLHLKFRQENPEVQISCLCKLHSNMQFMADRLFFHKIIKTSKLTDLINSVSCDDVTKECMHRECLDCRDKKLETSAFDDGEQTWWFQWRSIVEDREKKKKDGSKQMIKVHYTAKEKVHGPMHKLFEDFSDQLTKKMGKHM